MNPSGLTEAWKRLRDGLVRDHPDIDEETLADTLDGITGAKDLVASLIRDSNEDAAQAHGLGEYIASLESRKARLIDRAAKRKAAALTLLQEIDERKLERPEFTASVTHDGRIPRITHSVDAVLSLIGKVLPGWSYRLIGGAMRQIEAAKAVLRERPDNG